MIKKPITIQIANGLEARPVALLVQVASQYESDIYVECAEKRRYPVLYLYEAWRDRPVRACSPLVWRKTGMEPGNRTSDCGGCHFAH